MMHRISVIVPVYNDPDGLKNTIQSLVALTFPKDKYEIIIIDNGSIDNTLDIARIFEKEYPDFIKLEIEKEIRTSYAARNKGLLSASGEIICFIDADMWVQNNYLDEIDKFFNYKDVDYLGCNVEHVIKKENFCAKYDKLIGFPIKENIINNHFFPTCCLAVRKEVIDKLGCFDARFESGGDHEFGLRVYEAGFKQQYAEDVIVYHPARSSYSALINKSKRVARGVAQLNYYYPGRFGKHYKKQFNFKSINILTPGKALTMGKNQEVKIDLFDAIAIFILDMIMRFERFFSVIKETRRLNSLNYSKQ